MARRLKAMLADPLLAQRAEIVGRQLAGEDGTCAACDALEELYRSSRKDSTPAGSKGR